MLAMLAGCVSAVAGVFDEDGILEHSIGTARNAIDSHDAEIRSEIDGLCELDLFKSIVFPEVIRYDEYRNFCESRSDEIIGTDFSIGPFQIKPSFVLGLLEEAARSRLDDLGCLDVAGDASLLNDMRYSIKVVKLFIITVYHNNGWLRDLSLDDQVKYLSTAYTWGRFGDISGIDRLFSVRTWTCDAMQWPARLEYWRVAFKYSVAR